MNLLQAAGNGDVEAVRFYVNNGDDIGYRNTMGFNALMEAAWHGYDEIVRLLLEFGVNHVNMYGFSALMAASWCGHEKVVRLLLDHGVDIDLVDASGQTALMNASDIGHMNIVRMLIDNGADITITDIYGRTAISHASNTPVRRLLICRLVCRAIRDRRYAQFKVIRHWVSFKNLYSPSSNQMFYEMGTQLRIKQSFLELQQDVPHLSEQNYAFYINGCEN